MINILRKLIKDWIVSINQSKIINKNQKKIN